MAILSTKAKDSGYTALPSYLISDAIISETNQIQATLKATSASLDKDIEAKNDEVNSLKSGYRGGGSSPMRNIHGPSGSALDGEAFFAREEGKQYKADRAALDDVIRHNTAVNTKIAVVERDVGQLHQRKRSAEEILGLIKAAADSGNVFDTANEIAHLSADKQLLYLSVLLRGRSFKFSDCVSRDVRILSQLLQPRYAHIKNELV